MFPAAQIPGTEGILPYGSCLRLDLAAEILGPIFDIDFGVDETHPVCETTRTTISALRIGDYVIGTMPGEVSVLIADLVRAKSPVPDKTIVVGYAQGHVGYMLRARGLGARRLRAERHVLGPARGRVHRRAAARADAARADADARGRRRPAAPRKVATATIVDDLEIDEPAPLAGTVPATVPNEVWARTGTAGAGAARGADPARRRASRRSCGSATTRRPRRRA